MKYILLWSIMFGFLFGAKLSVSQWKKNQTFSQYLESRDISLDLLDEISKDDQKFLSEINSEYDFYELQDKSGTVLQALIPISKMMQIHLTKKNNGSSYNFDIIPIEYKTNLYFAKVIIRTNAYTDTLKATHNKKLAKRLSSALIDVVDGRKLKKGDKIVFIYDQSVRMGKPYLMPDIKAIRVTTGRKNIFIYVDEDGDGYSKVGKSVAYKVTAKKKVVYTKSVKGPKRNGRFGMPLRRIRITSSFSYSRWHPILHRNRPHHGTDFGAKHGTPLLAVNAGKVSFSGWMGGYGNVVKIKHAGGYESLYAHQSRRRVRRGDHVSKGQIIGYVGSTGRSTGPHLHFGLKRKGRWINPMSVLRRGSRGRSVLKKFVKYEDVTTTKYKKVLIKDAKASKRKLLRYIKKKARTYKWN